MTSFTVLVRAEQRLVDLVAAMPGEAYRRPTPCTDWDVAALLSHTLTGIEVFASAADGLPGPTAEEMFGGSDLLAHVDEVARAVVPGLRAEGEGHALFQPEVVPAADATATERLMAFMGRSVG